MVGFSNYDENHILSPTIFIQEREIDMSNIERVNRSFIMMETKLGKDHKEWNENVLKEMCELSSEQHHVNTINVEPDEMTVIYYASYIYTAIYDITNGNRKDNIKLNVSYQNIDREGGNIRYDFIIDGISLINLFTAIQNNEQNAYYHILKEIRAINNRFGFEKILDDVLTDYIDKCDINLNTMDYIKSSEEFKYLFAHIILTVYLQLGLSGFIIISRYKNKIIGSKSLSALLSNESRDHLYNILNFGRTMFGALFSLPSSDNYKPKPFIQSINDIIYDSLNKTPMNIISTSSKDLRPVLIYMVSHMFINMNDIYKEYESKHDLL